MLKQPQKLISYVDLRRSLSVALGVPFAEKIEFQCPCGYHFELFGIMDYAISKVKLHVESFHKYELPFGITNDEAKMLLREGQKETKPKISNKNADLTQTKPYSSFENTTFTLRSLLDKLLGEDIEGHDS